MGLESVTYVGDLNASNPASTDAKSQGDDHIRNEKTALLNSFAGFTGAILVTGTDGGSANTYTLTPTNALPAYGTKMIAIFSPNTNNTGASTLNISSLGAKNIKSVSGATLVADELVANCVYAAAYNGTEFRLLSTTKQYIDQLAMSASLPAKVGGNVIFSPDGLTASFKSLFDVPDFWLM